jgi:hypothetical protein
MQWIKNLSNSITRDFVELVNFLQTDEIKVMCNVSAKEGKAAAAWIISSGGAFWQALYIKGAGNVPEHNCEPHKSFVMIRAVLCWQGRTQQRL